MDRLELGVRLSTYRKGDDLPQVWRQLVDDLEGQYERISARINYLLARSIESVTAHTGDFALAESDQDTVHTNAGAGGTVTLTLPTTAREGTIFIFAVQAAQELRIDPGADTIRDDSGQTADKYKYASAIGACLTLVKDSNGDWVTIAKNGTWTEEA
jgi:hypothetical protein